MASCGAKKNMEEEKEPEKKKQVENYNDGMAPAQRMAALKDIFNKVDEDGDKLLTMKEWKECSKKLDGDKYSDEAAEKAFKEIDKTNNGTISLAELDLYIATLQLDAVRDKFKNADKSGDRKLDKKEFLKFFTSEGMKKKAIAKLWKKCDKNNDGNVSYSEFSTWMEREMADGVLRETFGDMFVEDEKERKAQAKKNKK